MAKWFHRRHLKIVNGHTTTTPDHWYNISPPCEPDCLSELKLFTTISKDYMDRFAHKLLLLHICIIMFCYFIVALPLAFYKTNLKQNKHFTLQYTRFEVMRAFLSILINKKRQNNFFELFSDFVCLFLNLRAHNFFLRTSIQKSP